MVRKDTESIVINIAIYTITIVFTLMCIIPFMRIISQAFSEEIYVSSGEVGLLPRGFTLNTFEFLASSNTLMDSLKISVISTIVFTVIAISLTIITAYPLSRSYLKGVRYLNFFIVFTMLFSGGIIPTYLVVRNLGIINTFWALIIPHAVSAYNVILLVAFMRTLSVEYEEAAKMEGASQYLILFKIMVPLSKPIIATLLLFYAVQRWNMWFDVIMYINNSRLNTMQVVLRNLLLSMSDTIMSMTVPNESPLISVQAASIIFTIIPIVILYPFLQKHFVKGIMLGGVKA
jgi:putative aldouronate transport system permease protein